ncbi:MAG TPA: CHRD domain-containing protein [Phycisphaerae bacterium]
MSRRSCGVLASAVVALLVGCPPSGGGGGFVNTNTGNGNGAANANRNGNRNGNANANPNANGGAGIERDFIATLTGAAEVPATASLGTGTGTFTLNAAETELSFTISATGLTGEVIAAHFHRGATNVSGPVVFNITSSVVSADGQATADGTWPIGSADRDALLAGDIYVNLHTVQFPDGEIRGQLTEIGNMPRPPP